MNRTSGRIMLIVAAFALFLVPVAAIAAGGFTDVEDTNVFVGDIQWMRDTGVTAGCNPPANDHYCPKDNVTREQMSAFMHRLAVNQIVDAATAIEADNADTLDGKNSTAFAASGHDHDADYLAIDGKAVDADELDGMNSTAFKSIVAEDRSTFAVPVPLPGGTVETLLLSVTGFNVPASGGVLTAMAAESIAMPSPTLGLMWIEVGGDGTCSDSAPAPDNVMLWAVEGVIALDTFPVTEAQAVAAGTYRVDLCGMSTLAGSAFGGLIVEWHEDESGAGLAAAGAGISWDEATAYLESLGG